MNMCLCTARLYFGQSVVEKKLKREENITKFDLGREKFIERVWEWKNQFVHLNC